MSEAFVGEIRMFAGTYAPVNWLLCDGSAQSIQAYQVLYSLIGTTYGGDGTTTFNLPDLRGRLPMGQGQGTKLTPRVLGQSTGSETVAVPMAGLPSHTHALQASSASATTSSPQGQILAQATGLYDTVTTKLVPLADTVSQAGQGLPHDNVMPFLCVNFIICCNGLYPSRP
ncbi:MAG: tail fiber protein [Candidatus Wallbacteria bacterium]|nr:tail fiber protein [Candidatus Wallbacteria bacterium]MBI4867366.1 tail fiber protein [Candidatus Wallbacteria bacterium]